MMKHHLSTDAGKELTEKIGLVYQIKVSPKKLGFEEVTCIVDLKKGEVTKGKYEGGKVDATFSFKDDDFFQSCYWQDESSYCFHYWWQGCDEDKG
uniref:SCP2 domain-containing protein n=1 Tax=Brassica oleracea TaxID=3712 RepID=A0A3P6FR19_BRAOL|nr:unnamed protein product [Brassica oleracea]